MTEYQECLQPYSTYTINHTLVTKVTINSGMEQNLIKLTQGQTIMARNAEQKLLFYTNLCVLCVRIT